jgi:hypothetical protein
MVHLESFNNGSLENNLLKPVVIWEQNLESAREDSKFGH